MSVSEAFEVVLLDEKTLDEIEEPVKDFEILDLNAANANDSGNSGKNAIGQAHDMFSKIRIYEFFCQILYQVFVLILSNAQN